MRLLGAEGRFMLPWTETLCETQNRHAFALKTVRQLLAEIKHNSSLFCGEFTLIQMVLFYLLWKHYCGDNAGIKLDADSFADVLVCYSNLMFHTRSIFLFSFHSGNSIRLCQNVLSSHISYYARGEYDAQLMFVCEVCRSIRKMH